MLIVIMTLGRGRWWRGRIRVVGIGVMVGLVRMVVIIVMGI